MNWRKSALNRLLSLLLLVPAFGCNAATDVAQSEPPSSKRHALVVGAWKYPQLDERSQLRGPKNDAILVRRLLLENGFKKENIHVLSDDVEGASGSPTRAAIMAALDDFAGKAKQGKGDFFYLHFGGHGSQQPAAEVDDETGREADGLDEIFLPVDIGKWNGDIGVVENAITDNEIGDAIQSMRASGAFVWAVFDSCHSGTMTRGVPLDDVRMRKVTPEALGIPDAVLTRAAASGVRTRGAAPVEDSMLDAGGDAGEKTGGFVAFYAAQTTEQTPEMRLPAGDPDRKSMGLFSFTLMQVLAENPGITYRQAMQQVLHRYAAGRIRRPTPMAEGVSLDAPVFGTKETERVMQWPVTRLKDGLQLAGGSLHQLSKDALLAVVPSPAAGDDEVIGYVRITDARLVQSRIVSEEYKGKPVIDPKTLPKGAQARLEVSSLPLTLRVALPQEGDANHPQVSRIRDILEDMQDREKDQPAGLLLRWVEPGESADIHLAVLPDPLTAGLNMHLWLLPPTGELERSGPGKTPSISLAGKSDAQLASAIADNLVSIAKVTNLMRLVGHVSKGSGGASKVEVKLSVTRAEGEPVDGCALKGTGVRREPIESGVRSNLYANDGLSISIGNRGKSAADVTLLFVDSYYGIQVLYPIFDGQTTRLEAGASQSYCIPVTVETVGIEHVLSIVVPAKRQTTEADFSFLAQASLPKTRGAATRGDDITRLFRQAGFGQTGTRGLGLAPTGDLEDISMQLFSWETVPE